MCMYVCVCMYVCMYVYTYACLCFCICICICIWVCTRMCICICIYIYICICIILPPPPKEQKQNCSEVSNSWLNFKPWLAAGQLFFPTPLARPPHRCTMSLGWASGRLYRPRWDVWNMLRYGVSVCTMLVRYRSACQLCMSFPNTARAHKQRSKYACTCALRLKICVCVYICIYICASLHVYESMTWPNSVQGLRL